MEAVTKLALPAAVLCKRSRTIGFSNKGTCNNLCPLNISPRLIATCRLLQSSRELRAPKKPAAAPTSAVEFDEDSIVEETLRKWDLKPGDLKLLCKFQSRYNLVRVIDVSRKADLSLAGSRVLLLDRPGNIHSVQFMLKALTGSYYDAFATLPPLLPEGPIGILGLGAGTAARIVHHFWPSVGMHGWELDQAVVQVGRQYFGLLDLEEGKPSDLVDEDNCFRQRTSSTMSKLGKLVVHVGDALSSKAVIDGGFAGLIVDLFSEGKVIEPLQQVGTWNMLKQRLKMGGRIMVNCGGSCVEAENKKDGNETMEETVRAVMAAFPQGEVCKRTFHPSDNCVVMTGPFPDIKLWKEVLPKSLRDGVLDWRPTN